MIKQMLTHSHVIVSRFDLSTLSYQMTQGMEFDNLYRLHEYEEIEGVLMPDITIVFDVPVEIAIKRVSSRNSQLEYFEKKEFQEKIRDNLMYCVEELRKRDGRSIIIVNANQPIEDVTREMLEKIDLVVKANKFI